MCLLYTLKIKEEITVSPLQVKYIKIMGLNLFGKEDLIEIIFFSMMIYLPIYFKEFINIFVILMSINSDNKYFKL